RVRTEAPVQRTGRPRIAHAPGADGGLGLGHLGVEVEPRPRHLELVDLEHRYGHVDLVGQDHRRTSALPLASRAQRSRITLAASTDRTDSVTASRLVLAMAA